MAYFMAYFVVEAAHTGEECLAGLEKLLAESPALLERFQWGCKNGIHTGWATIGARNEPAARRMLPASLRDKWSVTEVTKITGEEIAAFKAAH